MFFRSLAIVIFLLSGVFLPKLVFASTTNGTIDTTNKYVWGSKIGWLNFGAANGSVAVTDLTLTGNIWNENYGWIKLNPAQSGVVNDGSGNLSGYAWGENLGWINFSGVIINSSGKFTGTATGDNVGTINFDCTNCNVTTDWRPRSTRPQCNNALDDDNDGRIDYSADLGCNSLTDNDERNEGGGFIGAASSQPQAPVTDFKILINNGAVEANTTTVVLDLFGGVDANYVWLGEDVDFFTGGRFAYDAAKNFNTIGFVLSPGEGSKTVYAKFCTVWGQCSTIVSDSIIYKKELFVEEDLIETDIDKTPDEIFAPQIEEAVSEQTGGEVIEVIKNVFDQTAEFLGAIGSNITDLVEKTGLELPHFALSLPNIFSSPIPAGNLLDLPALAAENFIRLVELTPDLFSGKKLFLPKAKIESLVAEQPPKVFSSKWGKLPAKSLGRFVLAPLPKEIAALGEKIPGLQNTFNSVGVNRFTDLAKLQDVKLAMPGLKKVSAALGGKSLTLAELEQIKTLPLEKLPIALKEKLPTEVVFSQTMGATLDINSFLTFSKTGEVEQRILAVSGRPLHLAIKPENLVASVKGYVVFRSRQVSTEKAPLVALASLFDSWFLAEPALAYEQEMSVSLEEKLVLDEFEYRDDDKDGIYTADIRVPLPEGEYEIITVMNFVDQNEKPRAVRLVTVVDPEGYIYEDLDGKETRIPGAIVTLFWFNTTANKYEEWQAGEYQQRNPQITDNGGSYAFLVPPGMYYMTVEAPGYLSYQGKPFAVAEGDGVHTNIELKIKYWWTKSLDWKTLILTLTVLMLVYNFYKDKVRERLKGKQ